MVLRLLLLLLLLMKFEMDLMVEGGRLVFYRQGSGRLDLFGSRRLYCRLLGLGSVDGGISLLWY